MKEIIKFDTTEKFRAFVGPQDRFLKRLRKMFGVNIIARGCVVTVEGEDTPVIKTLFVAKKMLAKVRKSELMTNNDIADYIEMASSLNESNGDSLAVFMRGKAINPKTAGQERLVKALQDNPITFAIGPAGTGKTYLSVAYAVSLLRKGDIRKIILVRPAVEAGEKLGFLPGDLKDKVDPYLRPLYDSLGDMVETNHLQRLIANDVIEVAPLAFMRGRTLNRCFVILDEAQNCSVSQMKMFLTRLGFESRAAITGDITQSDLPGDQTSGLVHAFHILKGISGISFVVLGHSDIVRHPLVQKIVNAYERTEISPISSENPFKDLNGEFAGEVEA